MLTVKPAPMPVQSIRRPTGSVSPRHYDGTHPRNTLRKSQSSESESVGGLGKQILLRSGESNRNKPVEEEKEMSGSEVLLAIQRAAAQRKRSKKKIRGVVEQMALSTAGESTGENGVDYSNVRSLMIKSDWGQRLDEFEKLLKEFQDMEL